MELILGHNKFFGINHKSESLNLKSISQNKIQKILNKSFKLRYDGFMLSTHPESKKIYGKYLDHNYLEKINSKPIHLLIPYALKINKQLNQFGVVKLFFSKIFKFSNFTKISQLLLLKKTFIGILIEIMIDDEIKEFPKSKIKCIYLHEIITDIIVSLNLKNIMIEFLNYCKNNKLLCGLATRNVIRLHDFLKKNKIKPNRILTHLNPKGFSMNPQKLKVENLIRNEKKIDIIAMGIFASGSNYNERSVKNYLRKFRSLKGLVIGISDIKKLKKNLYLKNI